MPSLGGTRIQEILSGCRHSFQLFVLHSAIEFLQSAQLGSGICSVVHRYFE
jgi:hypothetical protein